MKLVKVLMLFASIFLLSTRAIAQKENTKSAYSKNYSYAMLGFGIGNIWKSFLKEAISFSGITYKVTATGPFTILYEYGFSNRISGGLALSYSKVTGKYSGFGDEFIDDLTIFSAMARANYHFGHSEKLDPYVGGGIGYVNSRYNNDQSASRNSVPGTLGYAAQVGCRYQHNPSLGAFVELGYVNGSILQVGVSVKFQ